jgi:hypothetical protein
MTTLDALTADVRALLDSTDLDAVRHGLALADRADELLPNDPDRALRIRSHLLSQLAFLLVESGDPEGGYRLFTHLLAWDLSRPIWNTNLDDAKRDRHLGKVLDRCPGFVAWLEALDVLPEPPVEVARFAVPPPEDLDELYTLVSGRRLQARGNPSWEDTFAPGRTARLALLRKWGANPDARYDFDGTLAVHHAAQLRDHRTLRDLVARGADPNARDKRGQTPLFLVAEHKGAAPTLRLLVELGADVDATSTRGRTALFDAAYGGDAESITALVQLGADLEHEATPGYTALEMAARSDNRGTAQALLDAGALPTPEALRTATEGNRAVMAELIRTAMNAREPGSGGNADGLLEVGDRLGSQAARWADDSGEYDEYMAEGDDGGELIVEQYWEAHFEGEAKEALSVATATARQGKDDDAWLAAMKAAYREAFFRDIG